VNAAPVIVGFLALMALSATLVVREPSPGALAEPHADLAGPLDTCAKCHAEGGLDAGCLGCHEEIAEQVAERFGFHAERASDCASCHPDHHGASFDVMEAVSWGRGGRASFRHDHVSFSLEGRHDELSCRDCHRGRGYLGLRQECASCHEDVHGGALFRDCAECHGQENFTPAGNFDHDRVFALLGPHREAACGKCHDGLDFRDGKGRACAACHDSPHRFATPDDCGGCHGAADASWSAAQASFGPERHAERGFVLSAAHRALACETCHEPAGSYTERYREPPREADDCTACHEDVHRGQFAQACTACHDENRFVPPAYGRAQHATFALRGAHARVACEECHAVVDGTRRFAGTPRGCAACHDAGGFRIRPFDHARRTGYRLEGAHAEASYARCHRVEGDPPVRRYRETARSCASCHRDEHRGQFAARACTDCHAGFRAFAVRNFDHGKTRFPLDGRHRRVACAECHPGVRQRDGAVDVQYRPLGRECKDCHEVERR